MYGKKNIYKYLQMNPQAVFSIHLQHRDIWELLTQVSLSASLIHQKLVIYSIFFVYWTTALDKWLSFQNFHNIHLGWFNCRWLFALHSKWHCIILSAWVHHFRLSLLQFKGLLSKWRTIGRLSGLGINTIATNLCNNTLFLILFLYKDTLLYQSQISSFRFFSRNLLCIYHQSYKLLTHSLQSETWYKPSYPSISFHI